MKYIFILPAWRPLVLQINLVIGRWTSFIDSNLCNLVEIVSCGVICLIDNVISRISMLNLFVLSVQRSEKFGGLRINSKVILCWDGKCLFMLAVSILG